MPEEQDPSPTQQAIREILLPHVARGIAAGFTAGAEAMRELCAQWHDAEAERLFQRANTYGAGTIERAHLASSARGHRDMAEAMRNLPLPTPKDTPR